MTNGDMAFQLVLAEDQLTPAVEVIKKIMSDGRIGEDEWSIFDENMDAVMSVTGRLFSTLAYARQKRSERKGTQTTA